MNDSTFEELASIRLSRINLIVLISTLSVMLVAITAALIMFTPLREYIPGYGDVNSRKELFDLRLEVDSLEQQVNASNNYIKNLNAIIDGNVGTEKKDLLKKTMSDTVYSNLKLLPSVPEDAELRKELENQEKTNLKNSKGKNQTSQNDIQLKSVTKISDFSFFAPIKGTLTNVFKPVIDHYGIDIVAAKDEPIKAVMDGVVIFADWTLETGYTLTIQHDNNIISTYKHNSFLFKKVGNFVKTGEPIAIIGNTGELTTGNHLHFELWYNGMAVNPAEFINFN